MNQVPESVLRKVGLKITQNRLEVLSVLQSSHRPLNHQEIMAQLPTERNWDRVTIYRALADLEEKQLLNTLLSSERITYFELKENSHHKKNHSHTICNSCGKIECIDQEALRFDRDALNGFQIQTTDIVMRGICSACK